MNQLYYYTENTESTNNLLKELSLKEKLPEGYLVYTDFQTAGKGQPGNSWESENGKNLLFSILIYPHNKYVTAFLFYVFPVLYFDLNDY